MSPVDMAVRLYRARETLRAHWGAAYDDKVTPWRNVIRIAMTRTGLGPVEAMRSIAARLKADGKDDDIVIAVLLAAAVEEVDAQGGAHAQASGS